MMAKQTKRVIVEEAAIVVPKKSLFERVAGYLDANDWRHDADTEKGYFSMGCRIKEASVRVIIDVFESDDWRRLLTFSTYPVMVPEHRRSAVVEALTRINYQLVYGNFEMDLADGEVRFRTVVEAEKDLDDSMIERVLNANLNAVDRYFAALMTITYGNASPDTVIDLASLPAKENLQ
jgi:hypothetical protein